MFDRLQAAPGCGVDKGQEPGFHRLPAGLVAGLQGAVQSQMAAKLYSEFHWNGKHARGKHALIMPVSPLLYVPSHPARDMRKDLAKAKILPWGPGGK